MSSIKPTTELKMMMLGDAGVGKTCLLNRFTENRYTGYYNSTFGMEPKRRDIDISGGGVRLTIWDTAGEERYHAVTSSFYRNVEGIVLVFDTTRLSSYLHVDYWLGEIKKHARYNASIILVGNKCDEFGDRQVSQELATRYADNLNIPYLEASAVTGLNVERLFWKLAVRIFDERLEQEMVIIPQGVYLQPGGRDGRGSDRKTVRERLSDFCC